MIEGHRGQIAASEGGSVGSILDRHKKVKQSVGDSMKLANGDMLQYFIDNPQKLKEKQERDKKKKLAMLPIQPPADPEIQQKFRGRPPKMKDTTSVMGAMESTSSMLSPASTTAGPAQ